MKITRRQLRRLIREQVEPDCGESVGRKRLDMSLDDTGPHMKNAVIRAVMEVINTYRCMTSTTDLNPKVQAYRAEQRRKATEESEESEADLKNTEKHWTFEQYVDFALDDIRAKVFGGDYSVPRDMVGMREMKIARRKLRQIILQEIRGYHDLEPTTDLQPRSLSLERMPDLGEMPKQVAAAVIQELGANPIRQTVAGDIRGSLPHAPDADVGEAPIWPGLIELEIFDQIKMLGVDSDDPIVDDLYGAALLEIERRLELPANTL